MSVLNWKSSQSIIKICKESYVDHLQFDPNDAHYDPKSDENNPKWFMVDVKFVRDLNRFIPLSELKMYHLKHKSEGNGPLRNLSLFTRSRLSVQSLTKEEFDFIVSLENTKNESIWNNKIWNYRHFFLSILTN